MIPKNVISCWFGRGKKTELFEHCQRTQRELASNYQHIEINEDTIDSSIMDSPYMRGVLERKEFVKATEFGRLWGLWRHGGVYMDCDVELLRSPDSLLDHGFFIGREDDEFINGAVMGSVSRGRLVSLLLDAFPLDTEGRLGAHTYGPTFLTRAIEAMSSEDFDNLGGIVHTPEIFFPSHWKTPNDVRITSKTIAHHRWAGSWIGKY